MTALTPTFDALCEQMADTVAWYQEFFPGPPPGRQAPGETPGNGNYEYQLEALLRRERAIELAYHGLPGPKMLLELWCRRAGKNETDARGTHRNLTYFGGLQKARNRPPINALVSAPTWDQVDQSKRRLEQTLEQVGLIRELQKREGKLYWLKGLAATVLFKSVGAGPNAKGEGAELYQVVNECQDTDKQTYDDSLAPMRASTSAPVIFQGTQGPDDCLSNIMLQLAEEEQERTGERLIHIVDGETVAKFNPKYGEFLDLERSRLTEHHPIYLMNYAMKPAKGFGRYLDRPEYEELMHGPQRHQTEPRAGAVYVCGVDCCGAAETEDDSTTWNPDRSEKRDSTVVTIGELRFRRDAAGYTPIVDIVNVRCWPGMWPDAATREVLAHLSPWPLVKLTSDKGGVGDGLSMTLLKTYGDSVVNALQSTFQDVSRMGDRMLGAIASGRLRMFRKPDEKCSCPECPGDGCEPACMLRHWTEWWLQFRQLRKQRLKTGMRFYAPTTRVNGRVVHDDFPKSTGYLVDAAYDHLPAYAGPPGKVEHVPWDQAQGAAYGQEAA